MKLSQRVSCLITFLVVFVLISKISAGAADTEKVLVSFGGANAGAFPFWPNLIRDSSGNLYGSASGGGNPNCASLYDHYCGVIFELSPVGGGKWKDRLLYAFQGGEDGSGSGNLVLDGEGNLYSNTNDGGSAGYGTIFELSPSGSGAWQRIILHSFAGGVDGTDPGSVISDADGNLYGVTGTGGDLKCSVSGMRNPGCGTIFKLLPNGRGKWKKETLYAFHYASSCSPVFDKQWNMYCLGGTGWGGVYKLAPKSKGDWTMTNVFSFGGEGFAGGLYPEGIIFDDAGNIFGTTMEGGESNCGLGGGCGVVYKLTPTSSGPWQQTVLHTFQGGSDGDLPWDRLVLDAEGNLYGTTVYGGGTGTGCQDWGGHGCGVAFEIAHSNGAESVIHTFGNGTDGLLPYSGLIIDPAGNLYGTTYAGGDNGGGTVYEISPAK